MAEYYESEPQNNFNGGNQSTERSIKSCYAVVYELENRKWVVAGEGGWSEVHLCEDTLDNSHRILAWTVKSQQVLMNCNVTAECAYKEKSKNFHSFSDENGNRYGLGFHKSESGLKQAAQFLKSVIAVITLYKSTRIVQPPPPPKPPQESYNTHTNPPRQQSAAAPDLYSQSNTSSPPQNPYKNQQNAQKNTNQNQNQAPPMFSQSNNINNINNGYDNKKEEKMNSHINIPPTYHLNTEQQKSLPSVEPGGILKILPPKQRKHFSGDSSIKNPSSVEHKIKVTHDKETGLYSGLPPEWLDHLNKQFGVNPKQLPCVSIPQADYASKIPNVLVRLRQALEEADGYKQVGIFRLAPNANANKLVKEMIDKGQLADGEEKIDVNVYANLIKVWFRDLPDPLLNCVNPDLIECVGGVEDASNVVAGLPEPNKSIFLWLCDMCVEIGRYRKVNKMGPQNMAIVVGPNLFNTEKFENPMKAMTYSGKVVEFFKHAILWREKMLG